ncbi:DUF2935 domain-containing protein [Alicyclobacillus shizuokensis]|uniref:DUF2935 domain-containing protein n=1 Tax=Alicyclobacillus shizuokensis TaxID=392014 RepID=UPI000AEDA2B7|nr:DUF2935 domain-containing protein [Alicyclobacillus shizuokensis]
MSTADFVRAATFEHRFWLQVLGDHARFIHESLSPRENREIARARHFIEVFDELLQEARRPDVGSRLHLLTQRASNYAEQIREFKLHLLRRHLLGEVSILLPPTFLNHTVNEVEEYIRVLHCLLAGEVPPPVHSVHHHLLWLPDAATHADIIKNSVDFVEKDLIARSKRFSHHFEAYYLQALELAGYLRANVDQFPALDRFNHMVGLEMRLFRGFLNEIQELELSDQVLGTLSILLPDHMAREECYYLIKLAQTAGGPTPDCDPTTSRAEERNRDNEN